MAELPHSIKIVNVVISSDIGCEIDLKHLTKVLAGAEYNPKRFPGLIFRTENPMTAVLLFRTGKMICTGGKSLYDSLKGVDNVVRCLQDIGIDASMTPQITVRNVVASADLQSP